MIIWHRVARLKKIKRPNKGQISFKKLVKITKLKFRISKNT